MLTAAIPGKVVLLYLSSYSKDVSTSEKYDRLSEQQMCFVLYLWKKHGMENDTGLAYYRP